MLRPRTAFEFARNHFLLLLVAANVLALLKSAASHITRTRHWQLFAGGLKCRPWPAHTMRRLGRPVCVPRRATHAASELRGNAMATARRLRCRLITYSNRSSQMTVLLFDHVKLTNLTVSRPAGGEFYRVTRVTPHRTTIQR